MIGGIVILKCSKKRWEKACHSFSQSKDSKRLKEFGKWALDSDIDYEFEYLGVFGEIECASGGNGQTFNKIVARCLREINRNY